MVDAKLVSLACTAIGVIGALVGAVVGVLFILNEEFVVATIQCNTTVPDSLGNSTNCVDNSLVAAGEVCQVGNLGLFKAGFTPECTYGQVGYEISSQLQPFESNPTEFGILFPAQTNFAGLFPGIEFTTCEEFFDNALLASAFQAAGVSQLTSGFGTFEEEIKNEFEDGINVTLRGLVDGLTPLLCPSAYVELATTLTGSGLAPPANVSEPYLFVIEHASYSAALVAAGQTFIASLFVEQNGIVSPFTLFVAACNTGYTGLSGLPATGFFSPVGSSVLCLLSTGSPSCSYADFIDANNDDAQIKPLDDLLKGYIAGANADTSESAELLKLLLGGSVEAEDIEELVRIVQTQNITGSFLQATVGSVTFATTILNTGFSKESLYAQIFNAFRAKDAVPDAFLAPARLEVPEFALICGFANYSTPLDENCTLLGLLTAVATDARAAADALALNPLVPEVVLFQVESAARNVELLQGTLGGCAFFGITSLATCLTTAPAFVFNPATEQTLTDLVAESLFGSFYGLTEGQNITSYFAEATDECEDDEKDIAAITQAQQLVPPGVALGFVGALGAAVAIILAALGKGGNAPKIITLVSGVVALVGVVLVLIALLGVQQAPIYQSVGGGDGPIEDNNRLFSQGSGYLLALISLAGGLVGSIFVIVGGALMFCSSSESSDILAKPKA